MSVQKDITIEDQHGGTLSLTYDAGMIEVSFQPAPGRETVEVDETDRRDLRDFLAGT